MPQRGREPELELQEQVNRVAARERVLLLLAMLFVLVNAVAYGLVAADGACLGNCVRQVAVHLVAPGLWAVALALAHGVLSRHHPKRDPLLLPILGLLSGWGLVLVDRLAPGFLVRQTVWVLLGIGVAVLLALWPRPKPGDPGGMRWLRRYRYTWLTAGLALLALTFVLGVNPSGTGLRLWLGVRLPWVGGVYFQPSELLKLLAIIFFASYMEDKHGLVEVPLVKLGPFRVARPPVAYLAPLLLTWGLSLLLLFWQRDLGAAMLFFLVFLVMLYLASGRWESLASGLTLLAVLGLIAYLVPLDALSVVRSRFDNWLDPWPAASSSGFQTVQSLLALSAGGILGQGVGQGFPTYIPVVHSDFSFAAVAEEWGLIGTLSVIMCLAVWMQRALRLALTASRPFLSFLAAGIAALVAVQSLIIMGGVTRLFPLTGVTLPFLSYGGSSMAVSCMMMGLLLKLSGEAY